MQNIYKWIFRWHFLWIINFFTDAHILPSFANWFSQGNLNFLYGYWIGLFNFRKDFCTGSLILQLLQKKKAKLTTCKIKYQYGRYKNITKKGIFTTCRKWVMIFRLWMQIKCFCPHYKLCVNLIFNPNHSLSIVRIFAFGLSASDRVCFTAVPNSNFLYAICTCRGSRGQFPSVEIVSTCCENVNLIYLFHLFARNENTLRYEYDPEKIFLCSSHSKRYKSHNLQYWLDLFWGCIKHVWEQISTRARRR